MFITGVSKLEKLSVFSELNNLQDISLDEQFSAICGISENEVLTQFEDDIEALAQKQKISIEKTKSKLKELYHYFKKVEKQKTLRWKSLRFFIRSYCILKVDLSAMK